MNKKIIILLTILFLFNLAHSQNLQEIKEKETIKDLTIGVYMLGIPDKCKEELKADFIKDKYLPIKIYCSNESDNTWSILSKNIVMIDCKDKVYRTIPFENIYSKTKRSLASDFFALGIFGALAGHELNKKVELFYKERIFTDIELFPNEEYVGYVFYSFPNNKLDLVGSKLKIYNVTNLDNNTIEFNIDLRAKSRIAWTLEEYNKLP